MLQKWCNSFRVAAHSENDCSENLPTFYDGDNNEVCRKVKFCDHIPVSGAGGVTALQFKAYFTTTDVRTSRLALLCCASSRHL
jgi:hypothetical protein